MKASIALVLVVATLGACKTSSKPEPTPGTAATGNGYLEKGPTVSLDQNGDRNTTLDQLEEAHRTIRRLEEDNDRLRRDLAQVRGLKAELETKYDEELARSERLERSMQERMSSFTQLQDDFLRARIARARTEQQLIREKLGQLIREER